MALSVYIYPGNIVYISVYELRVLASGLDHVFSLEIASLKSPNVLFQLLRKIMQYASKESIYLEINLKK